MKKLITLLGIVLLSSCSKASKYRIETDNNYFDTDSYNKTSDGCITFIDNSCGCSESVKGEFITVCGNYTIVENQDWNTNN